MQKNMMKRKKRFETMRKLLEIDEMPWGIRFKPKQQEEICLEEQRYEEEQQAHSPSSKFSEHKLFHPTLRVGAKKPSQSRSCKRRMVGMHDLCGQIKVTSSVMQRAEAVQETLDAKFPSFVKPMIRSNVKKGFWLSLPRLFCKLHLPDHDTTIVLEDENRKEYITKYLAQRRGLSAGWMGFSIAHKLVEGDVLVFHMVIANKLKVYVIRSSRLAEVDAALCLLQLEGPATGNESGHRGDDCGDPQPTGEESKSCSQPECENISDKDMLDNNLGLVTGRPESIDEHLQLALEGRRGSFSGLHYRD
ncbi:uncharacterized protein [Coffea arabica]|uniref:Uncharacterized protein isoform X1 n=1 Tax=Coffea arabica TaxID=13443 RepID=A0ABM4WUU3_COFAR